MKKSTGTWAACKTALRGWPPPKFIGLLRELYDLSEANRRFLHARLLPAQAPQVLDDARRKLKSLLSVQAVFSGQFRHIEVKRFLDQFAKAAANSGAVADLLVTDVETSFATFNEVGDFEPMVDRLYATLARLDKVLPTVLPQSLPPLIARLNELATRWGSQFGYGISDEITDFAQDWTDRTGLS